MIFSDSLENLIRAREGKEGACLVAVGTCGTRLFDSRFIDTLWWIFKRICVVCSSSVFVETQRRAASVDAGSTGSQSAEGRAADSPATQRVGRNTLEKTPCLCVVETNPILSFVSFCVDWCFW
jgi:hypothetical protein